MVETVILLLCIFFLPIAILIIVGLLYYGRDILILIANRNTLNRQQQGSLYDQQREIAGLRNRIENLEAIVARDDGGQ